MHIYQLFLENYKISLQSLLGYGQFIQLQYPEYLNKG